MMSAKHLLGPGLCAIAIAVVAAGGSAANGQSFYQIGTPRVYRIDPPLDPPMADGLIPQAVTYRPNGNSGTGSLILSWQSADGEAGDALEVAVALDTESPPGSLNDATLLSRIGALQLVNALDCENDQAVLALWRTVGTRQAVAGGGGFALNGQGHVTGLTLGLYIQPLPPGGLGNNAGPQGLAFGGLRNVGGASYNIAQGLFVNDPSGLWAVNIATGAWIDAAPSNASGASITSPLVAWSGNTGGVNLDPGGYQLRALDVYQYTTFLLAVKRQDPGDAGTAAYYLIQVDTLSAHVLAVANLGDLFDSRITSPSEALGGGLTVTPRPNGTVRIVFSTPGSGKYIGVVDGKLVPEGSPPTDIGGPSPTPTDSVVVWVCPGIGIGFPVFMLLAGVSWMRRIGAAGSVSEPRLRRRATR